MKEEDIVKEFLRLLSMPWRDPGSHDRFRELAESVSDENRWAQIIKARLLAFENRIAESVDLLQNCLTREPNNVFVSLTLATVFCNDFDQPQAAIDICDSFLREGFPDTPYRDILQCLTLFRKSVALAKMGRFEQAIPVYNELLDRFGEATEITLREQVAMAILNKGIALAKMGKLEEAILVYDDLLGCFEGATELFLRELVAEAMVDKGAALGERGRSEEQIAVYDEVLVRFGQATELPLRQQVARAMVNKGVSLENMGKSEEEIAVYDEVLQRFGEATELFLREAVAKAMVNKGIALENIGKSEEAIGVYDHFLERFGEATELPLRELVANALLYKAGCFLNCDRVDKARSIFATIEKEPFATPEVKAAVGSYYEFLRSRLVSKVELFEEEGDIIDRDVTGKNLAPHFLGYLTEVLKRIDESKQKEYFAKIADAKRRMDQFIHEASRFSQGISFFLVLREWNSYTPVIPSQEESDRGGGYFIRHADEGIVIDPGYDFIENFYYAGGLLCDIDHIIVTHAHDDHTAQLEALLMLFHRRWKARDLLNKKPLNLYLSAGVQRKFAGLLDLRHPRYKRVVTLCPSEREFEQRIPLNEKTTLTVLPAYHDDVITQKTAVGLGFEFATENGHRKVVFTGDSGLYPLKLGEDGRKKFYDNLEELPILDVEEGKALYERYPDSFRDPDLLVAHIGSIAEKEFGPEKMMRSRGDEGRWYYENHLGLLGTLTMLHQCNPRAAIISEFGSELKGFHWELVEALRDALHTHQRRDSKIQDRTFVIPGDLTTAYDIANHWFLCHDTCEFTDPSGLYSRKAVDCVRTWNSLTNRCDAHAKDGTFRTYLFDRDGSSDVDTHQDNRNAEDYFAKSFNHELPYHRRSS